MRGAIAFRTERAIHIEYNKGVNKNHIKMIWEGKSYLHNCKLRMRG